MAIALACGGCAQLDVGSFGWPGKPRPAKPDRIAVMWTDAIMNQPGLPGVRGFGARVMFHDQFHKSPIAVAGRFTVYAYDDTDDTSEVKTTADRKFVFTAEQLADHYSKSQLGHSYSFWIPWDEVGGPQRTITLVCRFESLQGGMVASEPAKQLLPGVPTTQKAQATAQRDEVGPSLQPIGGEVQPTNFVEELAGNDARRRMTTTTIELPPAAAQRATTISRAQYLARPNHSAAVAPASAQLPSQYDEAYRQQVARAGLVEPATIPAAPAGVATDPASVAMASQILAQAMALRQAPAAGPPAATGFQRPRHRALGEPIQQPRGDHVPMRPHPPGWPSGSSSAPAPGHPTLAEPASAQLGPPAAAPPPAGL